MDVEVAARDGRGKRTELNRSGSNREQRSLLTSTTQTAFFASTDGLFLGRVGTYDPEDTSVGNVLTHTALSGALALHTSAGT